MEMSKDTLCSAFPSYYNSAFLMNKPGKNIQNLSWNFPRENIQEKRNRVKKDLFTTDNSLRQSQP